MPKMRKSTTILSINNKEKNICTIKHGKSSRTIAGSLFKSNNNFDVAGDSIVKNQHKKGLEQTITMKKSFRASRSSISLLKKEDKQYAEKKRGLIYITHLPQDYNEKKVKQYFKNIGKITNVKVYKSKMYDDTGSFGYVEFEHPEVAKIAVEKMNNDYTFTQNIKAEYISYENQPKELFRFRTKNKNSGKNINKAKGEGKDSFIKSKTADNAKVKKKARRNLKCRQHLAVQCNLIPLDICDQIIKEIKQEAEALATVKSRSNTQSKDQFTLRKSSTKLSKKSLNKSLADIKSNKAILSKSLDSVKNLLEKNSTNSQNQETQTPERRKIKKERPNKNNFRGRIFRKYKYMGNKLNLNSITIKRIARELIRKRGYPLINLKSSQKPDSFKYK